MACQSLDRNVLSKVSGMFQKMITLFTWKAGKGRKGRIPPFPSFPSFPKVRTGLLRLPAPEDIGSRNILQVYNYPDSSLVVPNLAHCEAISAMTSALNIPHAIWVCEFPLR